jgi:hypothetical protein
MVPVLRGYQRVEFAPGERGRETGGVWSGACSFRFEGHGVRIACSAQQASMRAEKDVFWSDIRWVVIVPVVACELLVKKKIQRGNLT